MQASAILAAPYNPKESYHETEIALETEEREVNVDGTLAAQMRWEAKFPEMAQRESIVDYVGRIQEAQSREISVVISQLKAIYCFLETDLPFEKFIKMFDVSKQEYFEELVSRLRAAFDAIFSEASEKN